MSDDKIVDLDIFAGHRTVRLGGQTYRVPHDIPVPLMLYLEHIGGQDITDDTVPDLYQRVLDLFRVFQPDLAELPIGVTQLFSLVRLVYSDALTDDTEAAEEDPTPPALTPNTNGQPKPRRSRSSKSSARSPGTSDGARATGSASDGSSSTVGAAK